MLDMHHQSVVALGYLAIDGIGHNTASLQKCTHSITAMIGEVKPMNGKFGHPISVKSALKHFKKNRLHYFLYL